MIGQLLCNVQSEKYLYFSKDNKSVSIFFLLFYVNFLLKTTKDCGHFKD